MYLIVGLGNPEPEYSYTRHNMGFDVINKISEKYNIKVEKKGFKAFYGIGYINDQKVILCKPQTYMNLSGMSIIEIINFYKIKLENLIVIYDDIDIFPGNVKVKKKGSAGSHNGMKSVINSLGTENFTRVRIGTGRPLNNSDLINYVLDKISKEQYSILSKGIETGVDAIEKILSLGADYTMNIFNTKNKGDTLC